MRHSNWFLIAAMAMVAYAPRASAGQVVVSNLDQPPYGNVVMNGEGTFGQEFTTGGAFSLGSVVVSLGNLSATGNFSVEGELVSTTSASEDVRSGTVVGSLTEYETIPANGFANIEFDPAAVINLSASSFYWFLLMPVGDRGNTVDWSYADTFDSTGPGSLLDSGFIDGLGDWVAIDAFPWAHSGERPSLPFPSPAL